MRRFIRSLVVVSLLYPLCGSAYTPRDLMQILSEPPNDEVHWIKGPTRRFMAILTENRAPELLGTVILLHDRGGSPDSPAVISPLRRALPEYGWRTLSIAIPSLPEDPSTTTLQGRLERSAERIGKALEAFKDPAAPVYLAGHGWGGIAAAYYLSRTLPPAASGLVMIGVSEPWGRQDALSLDGFFKTLKIPSLDIYGGRDWLSSRQAVRRARAAADTGYTGLRQITLADATHAFYGSEQGLIKRVRGWLASTKQ